MIQVSSTYDFTKQIYEHSNSPSACVPNQSYTPKELVIRYSCGTMPSVKRVGVWDNTPDINNPNPLNDPNLDLVDIQGLKQKNSNRIHDLLNPKNETNVDEVQKEDKTSPPSDSLNDKSRD